MVERKSLGNDPLDWIGDGTKAPPESGSGMKQRPRAASECPSKPILSSAGRSSAGHAAPARSSGTVKAPSRGATVEPRRNADAAAASTELELPLIPGSDASTLERELLLMQVQEFRSRGRPRGRRRRSNRVMLALVLIFAACGAGTILFREARSRWNEQVFSLQSTIEQLERDREKTTVLFKDLLASKDRVIGEKEDVIGDKQKIISDLRLLHRKSLADLKQAWKDIRDLQEKYSNFFRVVFTAGARPDVGRADLKREEGVEVDDRARSDNSAQR